MTWTSFPLFSPFKLELFLILLILDLFSIFFKREGKGSFDPEHSMWWYQIRTDIQTINNGDVRRPCTRWMGR